MVDPYTAISKVNQIDKWLRSKLSSCGSKSYLEFIICIREMWPTETSSSRTFCSMKPGRESNSLILVFRLVSHMRRKSKSSAVLHPTWHLKSLVKLNTLDLQSTSGHSVSFYTPSFAADSHSRVRMTRSCIRIFARKSCRFLIIFQDLLDSFYSESSIRLRKSVQAARIFFGTLGSSSRHETKKWCLQNQCPLFSTSERFLTSTSPHKMRNRARSVWIKP